MAPQATLGAPNPIVGPSQLPASAPVETSHSTFIPAMLFIFLGLCLAYTFSYVLYRVVMSRRRQSADDLPDSPDRGVTQFMNGTRLTLNLGHSHRPTTPALNGLPDTLDEEKPFTDPSHPSHLEIQATSPAESSSTPFIVSMPSFSMHPNQEIGDVQLQDQGLTESHAYASGPPPPAPTHKPFSQRIAAKVKFLSRDRAEAITLDPKLAPVQGPLRPLSMVPSPSHKKRTTLFGLGLKPTARGHDEDPDTDLGAR